MSVHLELWNDRTVFTAIWDDIANFENPRQQPGRIYYTPQRRSVTKMIIKVAV